MTGNTESAADTALGSDSFQQGSAAQEILPPASDIAEHAKLRKREMAIISERLGRLSEMAWAKVWGSLAAIFFGAAGGGAFAALQMNPATDKGIYWGIVGVTVIGGVIFTAAALTTNNERSESAKGIKTDLDRLLMDASSDQSSSGV